MNNQKNFFKNFICLTTTLILMFAFSVFASAETDGFYTYIIENGEAIITQVDDAISGDVVIPETLGGYKVTTIGDGAFEYHDNITSVVIPKTVHTIGESAFAACQNLKSINIPGSLKGMGESAFGWNERLEDVKIEEGVSFIGIEAFQYCLSLKSVNLPESIELIANNAFLFCTSIEELVLPEGTQIATGAFQFCISLKTINIPESVTGLGWWTFNSCISLEEIVLPSTLTALDAAVFADCISLKSVVVNNPSTTFGQVLFSSQIALKDGYSTEDYISKYKDYVSISLSGGDYSAIEKELSDMLLQNATQYIPENLVLYGHKNSTTETYANENGVKFALIGTENINVNKTDYATKVKASYMSDTFDSDAELIVKTNAPKGNFAFKDSYSRYTAYDISFEFNGNKVQPNGKVTIKLPIPDEYNKDSLKIYYVNDSGVLTEMTYTINDGYIIFETDHFSEYSLVDTSSFIEPEDNKDQNKDEDKTKNCSCNCHKKGISGFIWKILRFFYKLFKTNAVCSCGVAHY